jgi:hypothetical protein
MRVRACRARRRGPAVGDNGAGGWVWRPLPEPGLGGLASRARQWELSRYRAYHERLAERDIARTFARCTEFLAQAAGRGYYADPGDFIQPARGAGLAWPPGGPGAPSAPPAPQRRSARDASPYREYRDQLAGRPVADVLGRAAAFLCQAHAPAWREHRSPASVT